MTWLVVVASAGTGLGYRMRTRGGRASYFFFFRAYINIFIDPCAPVPNEQDARGAMKAKKLSTAASAALLAAAAAQVLLAAPALAEIGGGSVASEKVRRINARTASLSRDALAPSAAAALPGPGELQGA